MSVYPTYADVFRPKKWQFSLTYDTLLIVVGSVFIALFAQLAMYLPFSPVPITGQTFAVLLIAALYGSRRGTATVLLYLIEGGIGLPVFAGGAAGAAVFGGPTGGYLVGFLVAAFVVGWLAEHGWDRRAVTTLVAMILGNIIIYVLGVSWLSRFTGLEGAIAGGLTPFLVGDFLKIALATALLPTGWKLLERFKS